MKAKVARRPNVGIISRIRYRCRDLGDGPERGVITGYWTGEVDWCGKYTIRPVNPARRTIYLFADEIRSAEPVHGLPTKAVLLYQCGIANVFRVDRFQAAPEGRQAVLLCHGDYQTCLAFARGLAVADWRIRTAHAEVAGDARAVPWHAGPGELFREHRTSFQVN